MKYTKHLKDIARTQEGTNPTSLQNNQHLHLTFTMGNSVYAFAQNEMIFLETQKPNRNDFTANPWMLCASQHLLQEVNECSSRFMIMIKSQRFALGAISSQSLTTDAEWC